MSILPNSWPYPDSKMFEGKFISLTPTRIREDSEALFARSHESVEAKAIWNFMPFGPFDSCASMAEWLKVWQETPGTLPFTASDNSTRQVIGSISLMRITASHGCAELGAIWYAPAVQRTRANTECAYLLLRHLFEDLGYRRAEWKCDDRNERSKAAAVRLGFQEEGLFRQHMVVKGENRDTRWFAMLDRDWPRRKANLEQWLYSNSPTSLRELNCD